MQLFRQNVSVDRRCSGHHMNVGSEYSFFGLSHKFVLQHDGERFPPIHPRVSGDVNSDRKLEQCRLYVSIHPSFNQDSWVKTDFGAPSGIQVTEPACKIKMLFWIEEKVKRRIHFAWFDQRNPAQDHRSSVPVPDTDNNAAAVLGVLYGVQTRRCVTQLEISLFASGFGLLPKAYYCEPRRNCSSPSTQSANPLAKATFICTTEKDFARRCEKQIRDEHPHQKQRPKPVPKTCRLHLNPSPERGAINTIWDAIQWRVAV